MSPNGEVIGGAPSYDLGANPARLTLYADRCNLQERHASITFNPNFCQYMLTDLSSHDLPNHGIMIRIATFGSAGLDLYKNGNFKRKFILSGTKKIALEFKETAEDFDEVGTFLSSNNAQFAICPAIIEEITTMEDLVMRYENNLIAKYRMGPEDADLLKRLMLQVEYCQDQSLV